MFPIFNEPGVRVLKGFFVLTGFYVATCAVMAMFAPDAPDSVWSLARYIYLIVAGVLAVIAIADLITDWRARRRAALGVNKVR